MSSSEFEWPWQYNFPPFFTLQPNLTTRKKQLDAWITLILQYCKANKIYTLDFTEAQNDALFDNRSIGRKINPDFFRIIIEELAQQENAEWIEKQKNKCYIYWRTPEEWGKLIYKWAEDNGMTNTVCTLFELAQGDDTVAEEFYGLDVGILRKALNALERDGKAEMFADDQAEGVKFF